MPGCGFGHEALFLAREGFEVTAVDFAPGAIAGLRERAGELPLKALEKDLFTLNQDHGGCFDLVVEHTCFCAIPLEKRDEYAQVMAEVLVEKGHFTGLFWELDREGGPPFRTTAEDIQRHFSRFFEIQTLSRPWDSFENRRDQEWLVKMYKT